MDQKSTLVLITLALGTWTSGEKMAQALREVAAKGKYPLTIMSPGTNVEEILEIVKDISANYDQTIIVGYPPFIKTVIDEGVDKGIDWKKLSVKLGLGGEGYSEEWRNHMAKKIGVDPDKDLLAISGGYGAADVGMNVGREYPLTVLIRRLCQKDERLAKKLFHDGNAKGGALPSLLQYNPGTVFVEEIKGELVFTALTGVPIVRYNIHDRGGVIRFSEMIKILKEFGYDPYELIVKSGYTKNDVWKLPFFYCFGRSDGTVYVGGLNVYTENIESILSECRDIQIKGFKLLTIMDENFGQKLHIILEHRRESLTESEAVKLADQYRKMMIEGLKKVNKEFKKLHETTPQLATPIVEVYGLGSGPFKEDKNKIKQNYTI